MECCCAWFAKTFFYFFPNKNRKARSEEAYELRKAITLGLAFHIIVFVLSLGYLGFKPMLS